MKAESARAEPEVRGRSSMASAWCVSAGSRRELLEHLLDRLSHVRCLLLRVAGQFLLRGATPNSLLRHAVEQVDHERPVLIAVHRSRRRSETAAPSPAAAESVVKRVQRLLVTGGEVRRDA